MTGPSPAAERIVALDVLRGVAVFGILLLNILGFGLVSSGYFDPTVGTGATDASHATNLGVWAAVDVFFEGIMRALFSMLFGAGIVLFLRDGRSGRLHYKRTFWLLMFGLLDAFVLLWFGDILIVYALAGALLYLVRNASPARLCIAGVILMSMLSAIGFIGKDQMSYARSAAIQIDSGVNAAPSAEEVEWASAWTEFSDGFLPDQDALAAELTARQGSYASAFAWNLDEMVEVLLFVIPVVMFWDALAMMLLGMALFKWGVISGQRSRRFYLRLALGGLLLGLVINGYEVASAYHQNFGPLHTFSYFQWTYHWGRLAMALGYLGLVMLWCHSGGLTRLRAGFADVGRMALTNYLGQSLICLLLFTGAGLALVGELERWQLYVIVLLIWIAQYVFSRWWMDRHRFGPLEGAWRRLTYGRGVVAG